MPHIDVKGKELKMDSPYFIEGLPGVGLVGKIATDHIIEQFDMELHASVECDGIPDVGMFEKGKYEIQPPVRIYADEENDLLALRSDVPVSQTKAECFSDCITEWLKERNATPIYISGLPKQRAQGVPPALYGIGNGDGNETLEKHGIAPPEQSGLISGPTGALLGSAYDNDYSCVGLIADTHKQFPDPGAAKIVIEKGISKIAGIDVEVQQLVNRAEDIMEQKKKLAKRMEKAKEDESTQAAPVGMFQ